MGTSKTHEEATCLDMDGVCWRVSASECCTPTADIEGVSAVLTKAMEHNQDGSYRIAISVVAGDLQNAACYTINVVQPAPQGMRGDVNGDEAINIADLSALIDVLLTNDMTDVNEYNADVDADGIIAISDVSTLIDMLLNS